MPTLATSGMIGRRLDAVRNPPAGFLRSELDDRYQSACAVGAIVSPAESASIRTRTLRSRRHKDRKSTRLNSSHVEISYAVFCLKKKKKKKKIKNKKKKNTKKKIRK